jgi:glutamine synthetase
VSTEFPGGISGVGQPGFVARRGLGGPGRDAAVDEVAARIGERGLRTVRLAVVDQHGVPRGKMMSPEAAIAAMSDGLDFSGAIYSLDTGNQVFVPAFAHGGGFGIAEFTGFPDVVLVPDPATFRELSWADRTGWMLCDVYFGDGQPVPLDGRGLLRRALASLAEAGYDFLAGLEFEFSIVVRSPEELAPENAGFTPPPPPVSVFERGYQFLSEVRLDSMAGVLEAVRDALTDIGLPPRSIEDEWGPGQLEFSFAPMAGLAAADAAVLFRSAVKQVCQRRGLLASFMCRPALPNFFSSGWHLHQSLLSRADGSNAFASASSALSDVGRYYVAGLLAHAAPMAVFAAPTVNGYKPVPAVLVRPGPGDLGGREPRRAGPGPGLPGRYQQPRGDAARRAGREPVPLPRVQHRGRAGRDPARRGAAAGRRDRPVRGRRAAAARVPGRRGERPGRGPVLPEGVRRPAGLLSRHDEALRDRSVPGRAGLVAGGGRPGRQRLGDARVLRVLLSLC